MESLMRTLLYAVAAWLLLTPPLQALDCETPAPDASHIAVAGGSITEILYALGQEQRIVAVDSTSNYPPAAAHHPGIGYVRNLSAEGLLSVEPTLILGEHDMGPPGVLAQLQTLEVDVLRVPERFDAGGILDKVRCVGTVIGARDRTAALLEDLAPRAARLQRSGDWESVAPRGVVLLTLEAGAPVAAGRDTSGHGLLQMIGAVNVLADVAGWKPVSAEAMARARPDFIIIPERGLRAAGGTDRLLEHPALRLTPAAVERRVLAMDGMALLGFGPRTLDAALQLRDALRSRGEAL